MPFFRLLIALPLVAGLFLTDCRPNRPTAAPANREGAAVQRSETAATAVG